MKWIEMIRVRSSSGSLEKGISAIVARAREICKVSGIADAMVLKHALFEGDLAVVLLWDNDRQPVRTREGLVLADSLQRYGMVDHGVWTAETGFEQGMACAEQDAPMHEGRR